MPQKRKATKKVNNQKTGKKDQGQMRVSVPESKAKVAKAPRGVGLSNCAALYLKALTNAFGEFDELPCVPTPPSALTYRYRYSTRGSFQTGSAGTGGVGWAPLMAANNITGVGTNPACYYTTTSYTGTAPATSTAQAGVSGVSKSGLPYPGAAFSTSGDCLRGRLVGCSLRVKNVTADMYRQGVLWGVQLPVGAAASDLSALISNTTGNANAIEEQADSRKWRQINFRPQADEDWNFVDDNVDYSAARLGKYNMCFWVTGASTTNPSSFIWEVVEFWEFIGQTSIYQLPSYTRSHADPVGFARALEGVASPALSLDVKEYAEEAASKVVDAIAHSDSVAKTVEDLLGLAGMAIPAVTQLTGSLAKMLLL